MLDQRPFPALHDLGQLSHSLVADLAGSSPPFQAVAVGGPNYGILYSLLIADEEASKQPGKLVPGLSWPIRTISEKARSSEAYEGYR